MEIYNVVLGIFKKSEGLISSKIKYPMNLYMINIIIVKAINFSFNLELDRQTIG